MRRLIDRLLCRLGLHDRSLYLFSTRVALYCTREGCSEGLAYAHWLTPNPCETEVMGWIAAPSPLTQHQHGTPCS